MVRIPHLEFNVREHLVYTRVVAACCQLAPLQSAQRMHGAAQARRGHPTAGPRALQEPRRVAARPGSSHRRRPVSRVSTQPRRPLGRFGLHRGCAFRSPKGRGERGTTPVRPRSALPANGRRLCTPVWPPMPASCCSTSQQSWNSPDKGGGGRAKFAPKFYPPGAPPQVRGYARSGL